MSKNLVYIGVVVLAVIAVILGYNIYQQQSGGATTPSTQQPQTRDITQPIQQGTDQTTTQKKELTAEEKQVLQFPGPNASEAERKAWADLVNKLGNESGVPYLDITGCSPTPVVYRVKLDGTFKVKNSGQTDHVIYTGDKRTTIKANSEQSVSSSSMGNTPGDYGYSCDGSPSSIGIIQVRP